MPAIVEWSRSSAADSTKEKWNSSTQSAMIQSWSYTKMFNTFCVHYRARQIFNGTVASMSTTT